ncbi:MAG: hypothetical protein K2Q22_08745 [Cytophagales bacterium]|nr:hypothetical protein [Cytophagales bacterium]
MNWVNNPENGLHIIKQIGTVKFDVLYTPSAYVLVKELRGRKLDSMQFIARMAELDGMDFITLKLSDSKTDLIDDPSFGPQEINERLHYFSYSLQNDMAMEYENQVLPCQIFHFERSYDLTSVKTFTLGFEKPKGVGNVDKVLVLNAAKLGVGKVKIRWEANAITDIPLLKI